MAVALWDCGLLVMGVFFKHFVTKPDYFEGNKVNVC